MRPWPTTVACGVILFTWLLLCPNSVAAYRYRWALLSGDLSTTYKAPVFGPQGSPGSLYGGATAIDTTKGELWLYGGGYEDAYFFDNLWRYRLSDSTWTWISGSGSLTNQPGIFGTKGVSSAANKPPSLYSASMWFDSTTNELWLFGGLSNVSNTQYYYNSLWRFTIIDAKWTWMGGNSSVNGDGVYGTLGVPDSNNIPSARYHASIAYSSQSRTMYLMGGFAALGSPNNYNDLWRFRHSDSTWTWLAGSNTSNAAGIYGTKGVADSSNAPLARFGSALWLEPSGQSLRLFGGRSSILPIDTNINDMWSFNLSSNLWTWTDGLTSVPEDGNYGTLGAPASSNSPPSRGHSAFWVDDAANELWLFGGAKFNVSFRSHNDLWRYSLNDSLWTWMGGNNSVNAPGSVGELLQASTANLPKSSFIFQSWSDSTGNVWLYGGYSIGALALNSFWHQRKYAQCEYYANQTSPTSCSRFVDNDTIIVAETNSTASLPFSEQQCLDREVQSEPLASCGSASCVRPGSCQVTLAAQISSASFCYLSQPSESCNTPRICNTNGSCLMDHGGPCSLGSDCASGVCERTNICCKAICANTQECNSQGDCTNKPGASCKQGSDCLSGFCSGSNTCCSSLDTCEPCTTPAPQTNVSCADGRWIVYSDTLSVSTIMFSVNITLVVADPFIASNVTIVVPIVGGSTSSAGRLEVRNCVSLGGQVRIQASSGDTNNTLQGGEKILILSSDHPECFNTANVTTTIEGFVGPQDTGSNGCTQTVTASPSVEVQQNLASLFAVVEVSGCQPSSSKSQPVSVGLVAGVVFGVIAFAVIVTVVIWFVRTRSEHAKEKRTKEQVMHSKLERAAGDSNNFW